MKKSPEDIRALRDRIQQTLDNPPLRRCLVKPKREPRYDEVFAELHRWLETDAGPEIHPGDRFVVRVN